MKTLLTVLLALLSVVATNGQGQFLFNTRDLAAGNNVLFSLYGGPATGTNLFHWHPTRA